MSTKLEQQFNNNIVEEERANNRNNLFKKFKSSFPPKLQKQNLIFILFIYLIFLAQLISCYSLTVNRRHLRRAIEYQQNNNPIPRYQCPNGCRCVPDNKVNHLLSITCHWPYLKNSRIFNNFPKNGTKSLNIFCEKEEYIEDNILAIDGNFFGFDELRELKINNCRFTQLSAGVFEGLPKLRSLSIIGAKSLQRLEEDFFLRLTKLESLILSDSGLREFPLDGICSLQKLQVLDLSKNLLTSVRLGIFLPRPVHHPCQLINLIVLNIAENSIQIISEQDLLPFPALRLLNLFNNKLIEIESDAFQSGQVPQLQTLDLSSNQLNNLPKRLPEGLLHVDMSNNRFQLIPESIVELPGLVGVNLSGNSFNDEIDKITLKSSKLEQLDISWNKLHNLPIQFLSQSTNSLTALKLSGNLIKKLYSNQMQNFTSLKEASLFNFGARLFWRASVNLDLSSNKLTSLNIRTFEGLDKLERLLLFNNSIQNIHEEAFQELKNSLEYLNISHNLITKLPAAIGRLSRVETVDLSNNKISWVFI
uniref:Uncharacterized protein n=2 Tax=Meloidogyne incognita group TaxID=654580 RepID=A0A914N5D1_MELIC